MLSLFYCIVGVTFRWSPSFIAAWLWILMLLTEALFTRQVHYLSERYPNGQWGSIAVKRFLSCRVKNGGRCGERWDQRKAHYQKNWLYSPCNSLCSMHHDSRFWKKTGMYRFAFMCVLLHARIQARSKWRLPSSVWARGWLISTYQK